MKKLHLICNAHIDPVWQWGWDEGISAAISTFKSACDLLDEYDYIFCHNESMLYELIEKVDPHLFKRIQKFVKEGKWHIMGANYLQPDCLMPNGETTIRMIQEGNKFFKDKFNKTSDVMINFDSFGHSLGLVQIYKKLGYKGYLICRPYYSQFSYPSKFFNWIGPDGSKIVVSNSPSFYGSGLGDASKKILDVIKGGGSGSLGADSNIQTSGIQDVDYVLWGVGNHGGGPSRKDLSDIEELRVNGVDIFHSTPSTLFNDDIKIEGDVSTSLVTSMPGCYSSITKLKQTYRRVENLYYQVEKMTAVAKMANIEIDDNKLNDAAKYLFFTTFHDILPGTVVENGEQDALDSLFAAERILKDIRTSIFLKLSLSGKVAKEGEYPVFIFNYGDKEEIRYVEVEFTLNNQNWSHDYNFVPHIYLDDKEIPCQCIKEDSTLNLDWRKRLAFEVKLKPFSITRLSIKTFKEKYMPKFLKPRNIDILPKDFKDISLIKFDDSADPWAMSEDEQKVLGLNPEQFLPMEKEEIKEFIKVGSDLSYLHIVEDGDIFKTYEGFYKYNFTRGVIQFKKYKNHNYKDIKTIIEFNEKNALIRLRIPIPLEFKGGTLVGDGPYIVEEKIKASTYPLQKWIGIKKGDSYFAIINNGCYAATKDDDYLYMSLLRGAGYCFHPIGNEKLYPDDRYMSRSDIGRYEHNFRIMTGSLFEICHEAINFNNEPYANNVFPTGNKIISLPDISIDGEVFITAIKEYENGYVFRLYNPARINKEFTLKINKKTIKSSLNANEIVSILYKDNTLDIIKDKIL